MDFKVCSGNWPGATANPDLLMELLEAELARAKWPRVAIGKANVIVAENRNPRLIIDPSISGINGAALIPERYMLPGFGDIRLGFPLRGCRDELGGFSLDISAAHKTVRIIAESRGCSASRPTADTSFMWWRRSAAIFPPSGGRGWLVPWLGPPIDWSFVATFYLCT